MRYRALGTILLVVALAAPSVASAADAQLMAPIQKFVDAFNKGDAAGAAATHSATEDLAITDEVPPFSWRGAKALSPWSADLESDSKKRASPTRW